MVVWEPPLEGACPIDAYTIYYREVMSHGMKSQWQSVTVNRNITSYMLHLNCDKEYDVAITSRSGYEESNFSESKIWNFKTAIGIIALYYMALCHKDWELPGVLTGDNVLFQNCYLSRGEKHYKVILLKKKPTLRFFSNFAN